MLQANPTQQLNRVVFVAKKGFHSFFSPFIEGIREFGQPEHVFIYSPGHISELNQNLKTIIEREKASCLFVLGEYIIDPQILMQIRATTLLIRVGGDDDWTFEYYTRWMAQLFDLNITTSKEAYERLSNLNYKTLLVPPMYKQMDLVSKPRFDLSFIGRLSIKRNRDNYIEAIKNHHYEVETFGKDSKNGYLSDAEMFQVFADSKINLNFSGIDSNKDSLFNQFEPDLYRRKQLKGRILEIMQAGGFVLSEYCRDIETTFEIDKEIVIFHSPEDLIEKIKYYLNHEEERLRIAHAGHIKARDLYSYEAQFPVIISEIKELKKTSLDQFAIGAAGKRFFAEVLANDSLIISPTLLTLACHFKCKKLYVVFYFKILISKILKKLKLRN